MCVFAIADCDVFFWEGTYVFMCIRYLRADLALVLGMVGGDVAQGPARVLLHARALGVAAHRRDQGLDRLCASPLGRRLRWLHLRLPGEGTPHDEPIEEEGRLIEFLAQPLGMELEARHGPLPFLHVHPRRLRFFPPSMSRFVGENATRDRE